MNSVTGSTETISNGSLCIHRAELQSKGAKRLSSDVNVEAVLKDTIEELDQSLLLPVLASFDEGEDWSDPKWLDTEKEGDLPSHRISFQRRGRALCGGHTRNWRQHGAYCVLGSAAEAPLGRIARGL
jgi:hypothetical protein